MLLITSDDLGFRVLMWGVCGFLTRGRVRGVLQPSGTVLQPTGRTRWYIRSNYKINLPHPHHTILSSANAMMMMSCKIISCLLKFRFYSSSLTTTKVLRENRFSPARIDRYLDAQKRLEFRTPGFSRVRFTSIGCCLCCSWSRRGTISGFALSRWTETHRRSNEYGAMHKVSRLE